MRDKIIRKRIRADEVVIKNQNRELTNLELNADDNMVWIEKDWTGEYDSDTRMCGYCGKKFDRKAVYTTHMVSCSAKNKVLKQKKSTSLEACKSKKILGIIESEENSNMSEGSQNRDVEFQKLEWEQMAQQLQKINEDSNSSSNRRKRKRTNRIKTDLSPSKLSKIETKDEEDVDWNLDDEEEKLKIDNIKKEIIALDYGQTSQKQKEELVATQETPDFHGFSLNEFNDDDKDNDDLVIDEKMEDSGVNTTMNSSAPTEDSGVAIDESLKCIICDKVFKDTPKRNDHVINYHQRQKRFKCSLCDYHGYRIKDTLNHLNTVHQLVGTKETLGTYMETVMRNIDAAEIMKQSLIKKEKYKLMKQKKLEKLENIQKIKQDPHEDVPGLVPVSVKTENTKLGEEKDGMLKDILKKEQKEIPLPNLPSLVPISSAKNPKINSSALSEVLPCENFSSKAVSILKPQAAKSRSLSLSSKLKSDPPKTFQAAIKIEKNILESPALPFLNSSRPKPSSSSTPKIELQKQSENEDESQSDSVNLSSQKNTDQEMSDEQSSKNKDSDKIKKRIRRPKRRSSEDADTFVKISNFGKIVKNVNVPQSPKEIQSRRPIRNRIKPVNKDFVYDLSGLLKKESDVFKESTVIPAPPMPSRRESTRRKCTLQPSSTAFNGAIDSKILSDEEFFEQELDDDYMDATTTRQTKTVATETKQNFCKTLTESVAAVEKKDKPATVEKIFSDEEDIPLINFRESSQESPKGHLMTGKRISEKRQKLSVESEIVKETTIDSFGSKNSISYKMSLKAVNDNRAALYEPQYFHTISFKTSVPNVKQLIAPKYSVVNVSNSSPTKKVSAAASILEKFTSRKLKTMEEKVTSTFSPEQLCKKFEKINVNSIESEMGDESLSTTFPSKLEDGKNEFIAFSCETEGDNIILKALSDSESDNAVPNLNETASPNSKAVSDPASSSHHHHHLPSTSASHSSVKKHGLHRKGHFNSKKRLKFRQKLGTSSANSSMPSSRSCSKKSLDKRKHLIVSGSSSSSSNKRITVFERVKENQVKKSREQLYKKLTSRKPMIQPRNFNIFNEV